MSHVTYKWVMSHINESCHTRVRNVTHRAVMSRMSHVTYTRVMSHINKSCHVSEKCPNWLMYLNSSPVSHATYKWVMSNMNEAFDPWLIAWWDSLWCSRALGYCSSKYSLFHTALLQKRPIIWISLPVVLYSPAASTHISTSLHHQKCTSLLQKRPMKEPIFCKRDL